MEPPSATRSRNMSAVRSRDTKPELAVRRMLHAAGFRFRLQRRDLPGKPDLILPRYRVAVWVHGCFWHGHTCPKGQVRPRTNPDFWACKLEENQRRDARNFQNLIAAGWNPRVLWECTLEQDCGALIKDLNHTRDLMDLERVRPPATPEE